MKTLFLLVTFHLLLATIVSAQWLETTIPVGDGPWALVYNSTDNKVYCANLFSNNVTVIDKYNSVIKTIPVGEEPQAVAYNSLNNKVYCANSASDNVTVIDGTTDSVITIINAVYIPLAFAYNPLNNKVYCANFIIHGTVTVIDGATDSVIATIRVGTYPLALVYNTINKKVYCANDYSNTVTVIDDTSNSVDTTIPVGSSPRAFAWNPTQNRTYVANYSSNTVSVIKDTVIIGIEEENSKVKMQSAKLLEVYPNPAKSFLAVRWTSTRFGQSANRQMIKMFDVTGKVIREITSAMPRNDDKVVISLKGINPGIYFLRFGTETKKLLVVK